VQGYWDGHALREDKAKAQEERRLKALAKATIKMVTREWKKAVFVCF
jgi:helicase SWR1